MISGQTSASFVPLRACTGIRRNSGSSGSWASHARMTTVSAGTLQGTTTSLQGNIENNATLTFNQSTDGTFSNPITQIGAGTLNKNGLNRSTGGTFFLRIELKQGGYFK